ncbi:tRNA (adenosine(37)-N6)-threonylcarbamoyltransferase complex dimerization subunit type 1 TsaB [Enterobacter hormaechei]|jgi:Inactive homolog of metal-dependent proteases, putative molecular chaperone|uniref:tRNA (adenosine(37)-N6)-threonylcarbamoyltransferase complex dimerization subunit type 1 TsaB n=1 Tax=Enterobacter hormaechei TaxID=158836 RepID=UPI0007939917|nr:tRNA (adenosine(37)-N6)-threonylcarbamoyltransferase complex dimerization subunit type 1 TsaB [Enterobacter hormaechei]MBT1909285.1 tRNA (adenosine(37)-N6)-threonylcarbamoyltransferase complex dimerization subunit type 1 TsaB [Enterobacter hormaechei subsp. xiangfangensis]RXG04147.1 tRNA (adenosine(37)-N6)-threonylcarbamoyltransferase complex dimerization subunit type 1 TsaB [Enterobacter cloacae]KZR00169.1 tRNA N6-adenosine(37)-N6-threonylcarbamoyltransferase complex dimerization subunit Tsa
MRILAIDTATEACSVALWNDGTTFAHFEECPREHTQRILPLVKTILTEGNTSLTDLDALAYGRGPGSFTGVRIGIGIAQGLALGADLPMIGVSTLATMAQGAWRMTGATRVLAAIDARMGEVYWAEYTRDENGVWHGEETEAVLKPEAVTGRLKQLSGEWATVGTGWPAWPEMAKDTGLTLVDGNMLLPAAEDMLPIACQLLPAGKTVAVEHAEPVYLRNTVAWKKLPGRE